MSAMIMDGKALAKKKKEEIHEKASQLRRQPGLAVILVGDNPASQVYVRNKEKDCEECGIVCYDYRLPQDSTQEQVLELVEKMNNYGAVDGILVQLPLPPQIDERVVLEAIAPDKDVDAFHPENVGRIMQGQAYCKPCTPAGVMEMLHEYGIDPAGKHCVVVGRSNIVGKPMGMLLLHENATVTICHSRSVNLPEVCRKADILIAAAGQPGLIGREHVRAGQVVLDVGTHMDENGVVRGDARFDEVEPIVSAITPVPGGIGAVTTPILAAHTVKAAKHSIR